MNITRLWLWNSEEIFSFQICVEFWVYLCVLSVFRWYVLRVWITIIIIIKNCWEILLKNTEKCIIRSEHLLLFNTREEDTYESKLLKQFFLFSAVYRFVHKDRKSLTVFRLSFDSEVNFVQKNKLFIQLS